MIRVRKENCGYAMITVLIIAAVVTALVIGFITQVNTEQKISRNDTAYSSSFYAAEAGLEKLNSDLWKLFGNSIFPAQAKIAALQGPTYQPTIQGVTYPTYSVVGGQQTRLTGALSSTATTANVMDTTGWPQSGFFMIDSELITYSDLTMTTFLGLGRSATNPGPHNANAIVSRSNVVTIAEGPHAGLSAQTIPFTLEVVAQTGVGTETKLTREVQVALIPVFQFGIFSDSDLSFFAGVSFNFGGRVHSNYHLFLAQGPNSTLTLAQKVTTAGQVVRANLANGIPTAAGGYTGTVNVFTTPGNYRALAANEGSVLGGPASAANPRWPTLSLTTYNGNILSASTGAKPLTLPFVGGNAGPIEIIRRPPPGGDTNTALAQSRLYNQASLRILISDRQNVPVGSTWYPLNDLLQTPAYSYTTGASPFRPPFAVVDPSDGDFYNDQNMLEPAGSTTPLIDGYIRIDRQNVDGSWTDVTMEILNLGISQNQSSAILRFQRLAPLAPPNSLSATDYWPINMFDTREGRFRDIPPTPAPTQTNPTPVIPKIGIMNLVELDVDNLRKWFIGPNPGGIPGSTGNLAVSNNGYIVYFSDRRGNRDSMGAETGEFGFEDIINAGRGPLLGTPDAIQDIGEDFNGDGMPQTYGANLPYSPYTPGTGELYNTTGTPRAPYPFAHQTTNLRSAIGAAITIPTTVDVTNTMGFPNRGYFRIGSELIAYSGKTSNTFTGCVGGQFGTTATNHPNRSLVSSNVTAMKNRQYYFRRALRLVNGDPAKGQYLPMPGFTVASENPVYVQDNYNADTTFTNMHSYAAVIADAVTLLSGAWSDHRSFEMPYERTQRVATQTAYRLAIASGKGINFPNIPGTSADFGTDGGTHNFLRYLEDWGGNPPAVPQVRAYYRGSMVSLYTAHQQTGAFKCCTTVYQPPARFYSFDTEFLVPSQLPPGTPRFRDINNLAFRQTIKSD